MSAESGRRILRLAHRGDHRTEIENTIPALVAGCALPGIDGVEFDVRVTSDAEPILLHDPDLRRTFGAHLVAVETPAAALTAAGAPHLVDALAAVPPDAFLDIELKATPSAATYDAIRRARGSDLHRAVVSSFDVSILAEVHAREPTWALWLNKVVLNRFSIAAAFAVGVQGVATRFRSVTAGSVASARAAGLSVAAWTVTERPLRDRLERLEIAAVVVEGDALE